MPSSDSLTLDLDLKKRQKVLVVEDEPNIASLIEDWLTDTYDVITAVNGQAALQKARWQAPDVILLDIVMPDMGGYEVARSLQGDPQTNHIPVIGMTAKSFDDSTVKMIKAESNVKDFINKPFRPTELMSKIEKALSNAKAAEPPPKPQASSPPPAEIPEIFEEPPAPVPEPMPLPTPTPVPVPEPQQQAVAPEPAPPVPKKDEPAPEPSKPVAPATPRKTAAPPKEEDLHHQESGSFLGSLGRWMAKAAVKAVFLTVVVFAAGEWASRLAKSGQEEPFQPALRPSRLPSLSFELVPNASWSHAGVEYEINAWGLRDREISLIPSADTYRLFLLGGTSVFGVGVPLADTPAKKLEAELNRSRPGVFKEYEVINGGLWQFTLQNQWTYFEKMGSQLNPRVLVWLHDPLAADRFNPERLRKILEWPSFLRSVLAFSRLAETFERRFLEDPEPVRRPDIWSAFERARQFAAEGGTTVLFVILSGSSESQHPLENIGNKDIFMIERKDLDPYRVSGALSPAGYQLIAQKIFNHLRTAQPSLSMAPPHPGDK
jgi:CheY-like chemotaxis protein